MNVTLRSAHGRYLCAEPDGSVVADRLQAAAYEAWLVEPMSGGRVALRSIHGRYLCAEPDGHVVANRERADAYETWTPQVSSDGIGALLSVHGRYLCSDPDGFVVANRELLGPWERWESALFDIPEPTPLPRLRVDGQQFALDTGQSFTAIEHSDFNLLNRWQHGEDITPILTQRRNAGFNMLRVWTLYNLAWANIGVFLDIDYSRIPAFVNLCAQYGLHVEFTAYPGDGPISHWGSLTQAIRDTGAIVELVNEGTITTSEGFLEQFTRPSGVLASHGSGGSEGVPPWEPWDYVTFHTNGSFEEQRKVGHNAWEIWNGPTLTNETSRYNDVGMWRGAGLDRQCDLAYDSAAGAALLCAGSCFHSAAGKNSTLWDANAEQVARAWANGARSVPLSVQHGAYSHREDLETEGILRVYQRGNTDAGIVRIRV